MIITDATGANWRLERDLVNRVRTPPHAVRPEMTAAYNAEGLLTSSPSSDGAEQEIRYTVGRSHRSVDHRRRTVSSTATTRPGG